ncbi:DUF7161 family protein [Mycobacterium sp.]|uniref:DUF7161 family protein n=1 Tax=Mycobacterium sp. TaxID=1785 RepID=UPI003F95506F
MQSVAQQNEEAFIMGSYQMLAQVGYAQTGLSGKLARVLVDEPTDEIDWPADLPPGTKSVIIVDDTPNPHQTLRVHPLDDPSRIALVVYDQLAVVQEA